MSPRAAPDPAGERRVTHTSGAAREAFHAAYDAALAQWPAEVDSVDVPSVYGTTRVQRCGPATARPLLLLHGGRATSTVWRSTVQGLAGIRRALAVDQIGDAGRSVHDGRPLDREHLMSWLDDVLDGMPGDVGTGPVDLCGHSYGGWLALSYALHAPERVRSLALLAPTACFAGMRMSYRLRALPLLAAPSASRMRSFLRWETSGRVLDPAWLEVVSRGAALRWSRTVLPRRPSTADLAGLRVPTLLVLAAHDRSHDNAHVERSARRLLSDVRVITLPGASHHTLPNEEGARLGHALRDFLA